MYKKLICRWQALNGNTQGVMLVLLAMFCWAVVDACNKQLMLLGAHPNQVLFLQATVVLVMLIPVALLTRGRAIATRHPKLHLLRAVFIATSGWCAAWAVAHLPLAEASSYLMTASLFMLPLGVLFLGEKPHALRWIGVGIGFCGVLAILRPGANSFHPAALVALAGALMEAMLGVVLKKYSGGENPMAILTWSQAANWVTFGAFSGFSLPWVSPALYWLLPVLGLAAAGIYLAYSYAYRAGDASAVEAGSFSLLLYSPLLGYLFFNEIPATAFWLGAGLLVAGIALVIIEPKGRAQ